MFKIIGNYTDHENVWGWDGWTGKATDIERVVATFDDKKDAKKYIKEARLKNPKEKDRPFRKKSLLSLFEHAEVTEIDEETLPHNPSVGE